MVLLYWMTRSQKVIASGWDICKEINYYCRWVGHLQENKLQLQVGGVFESTFNIQLSSTTDRYKRTRHRPNSEAVWPRASDTDQHQDTESAWLHHSSSIRAVDQHHNTEFWCTNRDQAIGTGGRHTNYIELASKCRIGSMTPQFINIWVADRHHSTEFLQYAPCKSNNLNLNWLCAPIKHAIYIPRAIVQWL